MKNVNGAIAHKLGILKSIVLAMLVFITTVTVGCSDNSQKAVADIGGARGQEIRKESVHNSVHLADIGGSKTIKGEFFTITDIGGKSSGTIQFSEVALSTDIGRRNSSVGRIDFAFADIGGRKGLSTGNVYELFVLDSDIGGKGRDIIRLTEDVMIHDIGGGGKGSTTTLLV